jgi:ATP/maltotriose-dependent transcriptional regulator MalT
MTKPSDPNEKPQPSVSADNNSVAVGKIEIGGNVGGDIHIGPTIIQPAPAPKTHAALGSVPPASADKYVHRGQIEDDIRAALRKGGASAIVGLHAPGGTGKTELANRIAQEVKDGKLGFDSVLWVDVNDKTPQETLSEALRKCNIQTQVNATETDKKTEWHSFLSRQKLLVIFDDVRENACEGLLSVS